MVATMDGGDDGWWNGDGLWNEDANFAKSAFLNASFRGIENGVPRLWLHYSRGGGINIHPLNGADSSDA
ncbi:hypothetical protein EYC84_010897 [Monilinia fructicola]|uniref:Uncharacterized protein n=1 Tax=Monilinia fructicola TaxID=38448 RepID=A0A5M9J7J8_MONFR|nr:hypothetical protein EYC84_010897 [Monilinia fructicola]